MGGSLKSYVISPEDFDLPRANLDNLKGGTLEENAALLRGVLAGAPGPQRDVVLMNAAAVLLAGERVGTLQQGIALAREVIDGGYATEKLDHLIQFTQSFA